jgi:hypothetical protein
LFTKKVKVEVAVVDAIAAKPGKKQNRGSLSPVPEAKVKKTSESGQRKKKK